MGLFEGMSPSDIKYLEKFGTVERVQAGYCLCKEGDVSERIWQIRSGTAVVSRLSIIDGNHYVIRSLGPGDIVGELGFLTGARRTARVVMLQDGELFSLTYHALSDMFGADKATGLKARDRKVAVLLLWNLFQSARDLVVLKEQENDLLMERALSLMAKQEKPGK